MSPKAPLLSAVSEDDRLTRKQDDKVRKGHEENQKLLGDDDDDGEGSPALCLPRKLAMCAGLLAADCGLVFMQLAMLPTLQTIGVPVIFCTAPGCLSGVLALVGLPWLGHVSDGGKNPSRRKVVAVVFSVVLFIVGFVLVISGCGTDLWVFSESEEMAPPTTDIDSPINPIWTAAPGDSTLSMNTWGSYSDEKAATTGASIVTITTTTTTTINNNNTRKEEVQQSPWPTKGHESSLSVLLGIPGAGIVAILGFAFIDMGNDLSNSSIKTFVLASAAKQDHVPLLLVGVLMSALGGCLAAGLGVADVAALLTSGTIMEAVPGKTLLQSAFFVALTLVCTFMTLLFTPSIQSKKSSADMSVSSIDATSRFSRSGYGSMQNGLDNSLIVGRAPSKPNFASSTSLLLRHENFSLSNAWSRQQHLDRENSYQQSYGSTTSRLVYTVADNDLVISAVTELSVSVEVLQDGSAVQCYNNTIPSDAENGYMSSQRSFRQDFPTQQEYNDIEQMTCSVSSTESDPRAVLYLSDCEVSGGHYTEVWRQEMGSYEEITPTNGLSSQEAKRVEDRFVSRKTRTLALICVSMFFMTGAWQSFNVCITDYLGKVIYGGDPDADPDSQSYIAYQRGLREGSVGVLLMNVAYVLMNLLQRRVLTLAGPKAEQLAVSAVQTAILLALLLTDSVIVFYVAAIIFGIFRSAMYTIPFMLANELCQTEAQQHVKDQTRNKTGRTMALVTSMIPLSNILVSSLTGPLIQITGNPGSPMVYTIASTVISALLCCCI